MNDDVGRLAASNDDPHTPNDSSKRGGNERVNTAGRTLIRASGDYVVEGRTLEGLAMPWDTWATVSDWGGPEYEEAHARSNFDESLRRDPGPRPFWYRHSWAVSQRAEPIGVSHFVKAGEGMLFRAFLSKTREADEKRELLKDGALGDVSVGFRTLQSRDVRRPRGVGKLRVESILRELSLAPVGDGLYPQAKVLALRSATSDDASFSDIEDAVQAAVSEALGTQADYAYVRDLSDTWVVYCTDGGVLYKCSYTMDDTGEVTLGDDIAEVTTHTEYRTVSDAGEVDAARSKLPNSLAWRARRARMLPTH